MVDVNNPSTRMKVVGLGHLPQPATCAICGSGTREEGYLECGIWIDYFGNVLFCMLCAEQLCETIGALTISESQYLKAQLQDASTKLAAAEEDLRSKNEQLDTLRSALRGALSDPVTDAILADVSGSSAGSEDEPATNGVDGHSNGDANAGEPEPEEPIKVGRSSDASKSPVPDKPRIDL